MKYRAYSLILSALIVLAAIFGFVIKGVNKGIDFAGGMVVEVRVDRIDTEHFVRNIKREIQANYNGATFQLCEDFGGAGPGIMIRVHNQFDDYKRDVALIKKIILQEARKNVSEDIDINSNVSDQGVVLGDVKTTKNEQSIKVDDERAPNASKGDAVDDTVDIELSKLGVHFQKIDYIGPKAGREFFISASKAMILALICIMAYVWLRFEWFFGLGVVISLIHDAIATVGFYIFTQYEFDLTSIAAILTVIGYSVNDTVVIYDRIRFKLRKTKNINMISIINDSLNETLSRTVMTAATTLIVCVALALFGGPVVKSFGLAVLFGVAFGTYSSIFIATAILLQLGVFSKSVRRMLGM